MQLTREYFSSHGWKIINHKPDENGFVLWEARWIRYMENGSPYYCELYVFNIMYSERFVMNGETTVGDLNVEVYTEEELIAILKVIGVYDYYKKESTT
jgi:hypothetical protein